MRVNRGGKGVESWPCLGAAPGATPVPFEALSEVEGVEEESSACARFLFPI